jgi:hypothetical protein
MSHFFDAEQDWEVTGGNEDENAGAGEEEVEVHQEEDPWLQRRPGGRRVRVIPDIAKYLA